MIRTVNTEATSSTHESETDSGGWHGALAAALHAGRGGADGGDGRRRRLEAEADAEVVEGDAGRGVAAARQLGRVHEAVRLRMRACC